MKTTTIGTYVWYVVIVILAVLLVMRINQSFQNRSIKPNVSKLVTQKNEEGNVIVSATPEVLTVGKEPRFSLAFDTHTVDLSFNVSETIELIDDTGKTYIKVQWEGSPNGGHHRNGILTFQEPLAQTKYVELIITNVAGVQKRKLRWTL